MMKIKCLFLSQGSVTSDSSDLDLVWFFPVSWAQSTSRRSRKTVLNKYYKHNFPSQAAIRKRVSLARCHLTVTHISWSNILLIHNNTNNNERRRADPPLSPREILVNIQLHLRNRGFSVLKPATEPQPPHILQHPSRVNLPWKSLWTTCCAERRQCKCWLCLFCYYSNRRLLHVSDQTNIAEPHF